MAVKSRRVMQVLRHGRIRRGLDGTAERPRLAVFRSMNNIYAQVIDDSQGRTVAAANSLQPQIKAAAKDVKPVDVAAQVGKAVAEVAKAAGVTKVVFDRGGFKYHGRVKALAEAAREAGLEF